MSILNFLILVPIVAIIAMICGAPARKTSIIAASVNLLASLGACIAYNHTASGFQFTASLPILADWNLAYSVGADGLSLLMLLLTTIVTVAAVSVSPVNDLKRAVPFYACLLLISAGALGAFASTDLFFFYAFHELALIPTFLLIGIWGTDNRQAAAWKITIYLAFGSFILLIGLIGLYLSLPIDVRTFDMQKMQELASRGLLDPSARNWVYLCLLAGFGILISLFPFHTWAPQAYASAPPPAAMLHAGVLKKFGLYGLMRTALPMLPDQARQWSDLLLILLVGNIIYVGLVTISQKRLDTMLGYSSVMHMGYIFLGLATQNVLGLSGAALLMFAHGLSIAALFAIAGAVREKTGTLVFAEMGGLAKSMPFLGFAFGLAAFASIGLPGFANFASEIMIFFGAFGSGKNGFVFNNIQMATVAALWGVVISAVYMLRAYKSTFLGTPNKRWLGLADLTHAARVPLILLLAALLIGGFYPELLLRMIRPSIQIIFPLHETL